MLCCRLQRCNRNLRQVPALLPTSPTRAYPSDTIHRHNPPETESSHSPAQSPRTIFSGIQPTGVPHLGNYLGAIKQWRILQDTASQNDKLYFSVVDLHSLTSRMQSSSERSHSKRVTLAALLACGLSPDRSTIFYQSDVPEHAELHWILSCSASMGALSRMTQWKTKFSDESLLSMVQPTANPRSEERLKLGLFSYPVLQAADILLYRTTHVPVGEDQVQHLEFARSMASGFNSAYASQDLARDGAEKKGDGTILVPPEVIVSPARRIMSLNHPESKMSKSHELERNRILLSDSDETIHKKFRSALTDSHDHISYEEVARPGVSNLLQIVSYLEGSGRTPHEVAHELQRTQTNGSIMRLLKERAAECVIREIAPIRAEFERLIGEGGGKHLDELADRGRESAKREAARTIRTVKDVIGL